MSKLIKVGNRHLAVELGHHFQSLSIPSTYDELVNSENSPKFWEDHSVYSSRESDLSQAFQRISPNIHRVSSTFV
jgi:hypothetical protein